jgi:hypothetical protein
MVTIRPKDAFGLKNSLFFSLLAGKLAAETGCSRTASATTQSCQRSKTFARGPNLQAAVAFLEFHPSFGVE